MALTKVFTTLLAANTSVAAGTLKTAPVTGASIDCGTYYGGELTYKITNGGTAPTIACTVTFQVSHNGTSWYDYYNISGNTIAASIVSGAVLLDRGVMFVRAIAHSNETAAVTVEVFLQAITGL